jgi:hypothetical protein
MKLEDSAIDYDEESFESEQEKMKNDEKRMKKTVATVVTVKKLTGSWMGPTDTNCKVK